jgi:hypothetical protein
VLLRRGALENLDTSKRKAQGRRLVTLGQATTNLGSNICDSRAPIGHGFIVELPRIRTE